MGRYRLGEIELDEEARTLTASGDSISVQPLVFDFLVYLARHSDRAVAKDELLGALWPDINVTEASLQRVASLARRILKSAGQGPALISVQRFGYRLRAEYAGGSLTAKPVDDAAMARAARSGKRWPRAAAALISAGVAAPLAAADPEQWALAGAVQPQWEGQPDRSRDDRVGASPGVVPAPGGALPTENARVSIAVLPFVNMSSDPEQEYFSNGITGDITTDLSRWRSFDVASRNSAARFKDQPVDVQAAGRQLGVNFLVEGSVRRLGERIRITAQLVDARTGNHVWAERYDRPMADLFAVQDEVVRTIVGTLVDRVYVTAADHLRRKPPSSPAAYDLAMKANWLAWDVPASRAEAKRCLEQAIELDPDYGLPHSLLAMMLRGDWNHGLSGSPAIHDRAFALAKRGLDLADNESTSHAAFSLVHLDRRSFDLALRHMERAIEINPANPWTQADLGVLLARLGRAEEGLERFVAARRADPYFRPSWYWPSVGIAQFVLHSYAEALASFDRGSLNSADTLAVTAGCCAKLRLGDRARELVAVCVAFQPEATIGKLVGRIAFKDADDSAHLAECLRLAGMPE